MSDVGDKLLNDVIQRLLYNGAQDVEQALCILYGQYRVLGPYQLAKKWNALVDNSAEEFVVSFMMAYNMKVEPYF